MTDTPTPTPSDPHHGFCPDGGRCHHDCAGSCFRVNSCGPLSGVYPGDVWPAEVTAEHRPGRPVEPMFQEWHDGLPWNQPEHAGPWPLAVIDTETLGLDPDKHPVWEVAVILYDPATGATAEHVRQLRVTPEQIAAADERGIVVSDFLNRYDDDLAAEPAEVVSWFVDLVGTAHLVGSIVSFDEERLRRLALSFGFPPRWHYHIVDVEAMAVGHLHAIDMYAEKAPDMTATLGLPWKSDDLSEALGVDPPNDHDRHTALGDARWALRLYQAMTGLAR